MCTELKRDNEVGSKKEQSTKVNERWRIESKKTESNFENAEYGE